MFSESEEMRQWLNGWTGPGGGGAGGVPVPPGGGGGGGGVQTVKAAQRVLVCGQIHQNHIIRF